MTRLTDLAFSLAFIDLSKYIRFFVYKFNEFKPEYSPILKNIKIYVYVYARVFFEFIKFIENY